MPCSNGSFAGGSSRSRNADSVSASIASRRSNTGAIALSSTGRNNSASTEVSPRPSADVSSTFGGAISNGRVSVLIDRPALEKIARRTYFPGGS